MPPMIALIVPLGDMPPGINNALPKPELPVDPGYGIGAGRPSTGPVRPGRPVDPGYGIGSEHPGHPLPGDQPGIDNSLPGLPPEVAPPIFLPTPPPTIGGGPIVPPQVWPPVDASVQPPIVMPPPGIWPPPKPAPGYIVVWLPGYGVTYVKLGVSVGGGPVLPSPGPTPGPSS